LPTDSTGMQDAVMIGQRVANSGAQSQNGRRSI